MPQLSLILVALALTQTPNITSCEKGECGPGFEKCLLPGPVFTVPMIHVSDDHCEENGEIMQASADTCVDHWYLS
jgi:hypothetical protein